jgi:hypothetical protein
LKITDIDVMGHADGEQELELDATSRAKVEALGELTELVRGRLELAADDVPEARFASMWSAIDKELDKQTVVAKDVVKEPAAETGFLSRLGRWLDRYRSQIITGAVSAGAVATLALVLRSGGEGSTHTSSHDPIDVRPVVHRPAEIEALDTPDGTSAVFNVDDEDGSTTVIWVTPQDSVEGI